MKSAFIGVRRRLSCKISSRSTEPHEINSNSVFIGDFYCFPINTDNAINTDNRRLGPQGEGALLFAYLCEPFDYWLSYVVAEVRRHGHGIRRIRRWLASCNNISSSRVQFFDVNSFHIKLNVAVCNGCISRRIASWSITDVWMEL